LNLTNRRRHRDDAPETKRTFMNKYHYTALILGSGLAIAGSAFAGAGGCDQSGEKAGHGGQGRGAHFAEVDTNGDGKVSLAELTASRESWLTQVDTNKDGVATQAEIEASFAARRQEHAQKMFAREDANKDGRLTRDESRMPSAWFERADANKDGALTLAELTEARKSAVADKGAGKGPGAGKHQRFDANGDGKVDREELRTSAANQFTQLDKNKDGNLTSDEFRMHGRNHGQHRRGPDGREQGEKATPAPVRS
jgi:Ca2+-binding EF-hand superfamily protein